MKKVEIKWLKVSEAHDYPAAQSYLSLVFEVAKCKEIVEKLVSSEIVFYKAKDLFRASSLHLLSVSNSHVKSDQKKIKKGVCLSPLLLHRDTLNGKVIIADGFHRLCAVYSFCEDADIPCKIV